MPDKEKQGKHNRLIHETSPYLLQHAYNPVDWRPWGEEAFAAAREQDKLVLVSLGYSACHWCHVMERESFENEQVAQMMNEHFICIKVDREERPDVDQIYMDAVQLMTGRGGWPLNVFVLPDKRPVYGGTYFPPQQWMSILQQLAEGYQTQKPRYIEYAEKLAAGVQKINLVSTPEHGEKLNLSTFEAAYRGLKPQFDLIEGGMQGAPKFPMPAIYEFLLGYYSRTGDQQALNHVVLTLEKMARGGIYDQAGGGFARYSTDEQWKVPHFEKMLYDNGQLLSLYAHAYQATGNPLFEKVVSQTVDFIEREMTSPEGGFYAALDADSEGVEGKFYLWSRDQLRQALGPDADWVADWYGIDKEGRWEGSNILLPWQEENEIVERLKISKEELWQKLSEINRKLLMAREHRVRPGLDDKILTGWNALMLTGLLDAYLAFGNKKYLQLARKNFNFLKDNVWKEGLLYRSYKNGKSAIPAFLEDYALLTQALLRYYSVSFDDYILQFAKELAEKAYSKFHDRESGYFLFSPTNQDELFSNKVELNDNVIPASNSVMAENLFLLGQIFDIVGWKKLASKMVGDVAENMEQNVRFYANWARLGTLMLEPFFEIAVVGENALPLRMQLESKFLPGKMVIGSTGKKEEIPLLKGKFADGQTLIYVCVEKSCLQAETEAGAALNLINETLKTPNL